MSHQLAVGSARLHANASARISAWLPDLLLAVSVALLLAGTIFQIGRVAAPTCVRDRVRAT